MTYAHTRVQYMDWFTAAGFTDISLKRIGPWWYHGVRRHGLIMGCSVTARKAEAGQSPLQLGPKKEDVAAPSSKLANLISECLVPNFCVCTVTMIYVYMYVCVCVICMHAVVRVQSEALTFSHSSHAYTHHRAPTRHHGRLLLLRRACVHAPQAHAHLASVAAVEGCAQETHVMFLKALYTRV